LHAHDCDQKVNNLNQATEYHTKVHTCTTFEWVRPSCCTQTGPAHVAGHV